MGAMAEQHGTFLGLSMGFRCLLLAAVARLASCQALGDAPANAPLSRVSAECRLSFIAMMNNKDWQFLNDTSTRWCRIKVENKMSVCCTNAEFAKGKADGCKDCQADCVHTKMIGLCSSYFGKACALNRKLFSKNNISMRVLETFCVPKTCDNSNDLDNNALVTWYDYAYRNRRLSTYWQLDYSDADELVCPSPAVMIIVVTFLSVVIIIASIPLGIFLFKAPKERGRVMQGVDDDHVDYETSVEQMMPQLGNNTGGDTFGSGSGTANRSGNTGNTAQAIGN